MPKLYYSEHIFKVLIANGFLFVSQKGSHAKFRKTIEGKTLMVLFLLPEKKYLSELLYQS